MSSPLTLEELFEKPKSLSVEPGSKPTPEPKEEEAKPVGMSLEGLFSGTQAAPLDTGYVFRPISKDDDPSKDYHPLINFFRRIYTNIVYNTKMSLAEMSGQHGKAIETMQDADRIASSEGISGWSAGVVTGIIPSALLFAVRGAQLGSVGGPAGAAGGALTGLVTAGVFAYYGLLGAGAGLFGAREYQKKSGKDLDPVAETAIAVGTGLAFVVSERLGLKYLTKALKASMTNEVVKELGEAYLKQDTKKVVGILLKTLPGVTVRGGVVEGIEEGVEEVLNNMIVASYNPDARTLDDLFANVPESFGAGFAGGVLLLGGVNIVQTTVGKQAVIDMSGQIHNEERIAQVETELQAAMPNLNEEGVKSVMVVFAAAAKHKGLDVGDYLESRIAEIQKGDPEEVINRDSEYLYNLAGERSNLSPETLNNLRIAEKMHERGSTEKQIYQATGWFRGKTDGAWKYKLPTDQMKVKGGLELGLVTEKSQPKKMDRLSNLLDYPALYEAYPEIADAQVEVTDLAEGQLGTYRPSNNNMGIDLKQIAKRSSKGDLEVNVLQVFAHEIQHFVQEKEGFAKEASETEAYGFFGRTNGTAKSIRESLEFDLWYHSEQTFGEGSPMAKKFDTREPLNKAITDFLGQALEEEFARSLNNAKEAGRDFMSTLAAAEVAVTRLTNAMAKGEIQITVEEAEAFLKLIGTPENLGDVVHDMARYHHSKLGDGADQIRKDFKNEMSLYKGSAGYREAEAVAAELKKNWGKKKKKDLGIPKLDGVVYINNIGELQSGVSQTEEWSSVIREDVEIYTNQRAPGMYVAHGKGTKTYKAYTDVLLKKSRSFKSLKAAMGYVVDNMREEYHSGNLSHDDRGGKVYKGKVKTKGPKKFPTTKSRPKKIRANKFDDKKGSIEFRKDGKAVIRAFESADLSTMLHEIGHLFRRDLSAEEQARADELFKVVDGVWTEQNEEAFANSFVRWLRTGKTENKALQPIFKRFRTWLTDIYKRIKGSEIDVKMTKEIREFFDELLSTEEQTAEDVMLSNLQERLKKRGMLGKFADKFIRGFLDKVDVEQRAENIGGKKIGLMAKLHHSIVGHYQDEGMRTILGMMQSLQRTGMSASQARKTMNELVLLYEDEKRWKALPEARREKMQGAYDILGEYLETSKQEYIDRGVFKMGFVERITATLEEQLLELQNKKRTAATLAEIQKIKESLKITADLKFVPIPLALWLDEKLTSRPTLARTILSIMGGKKRKTLRIADLLEEGKKFGVKESDIKMGDIIASYAYKKGKDFANISLREAGIEENFVIKAKTKKSGTVNMKAIPTGFVRPAKNLPFLRDYHIKAEFADFLSGMTKRVDSIGVPSKVLNVAKMTAFWNPLFLPMYDTIQAVMLGSFNPLRPIKSIKYFTKGLMSTLRQDDFYQQAKLGGTFSTPFNNPLTNYLEMVDAMVTGRGKSRMAREVSHHIAGLATVNPVQFFKSVYNLSWKTAWFLDNVVRMSSVAYLHDTKGYDMNDASQRAALFHGDYAGVPANTRKHLNRIFFTPTFKIAMAKMYINMIQGFGNELHPNVKTTREYKDNFQSMVRLVALLSAYDMIMLTLGFDRDEWARRYTKEVETDEGVKELVLTQSGPHNMVLKYVQRFQAAMGPEVDNSILHFFKANTWEIHPLYRVTGEIVNNKKPDGQPIVSHFDPSLKYGALPVKELKMMKYFVTNIITILKAGEFEDPLARENLRNELGTTLEMISKPFTFTYLRRTKDVRASFEVKRLKAMLSDDVRLIIRDVGEVSAEELEGKVNRYITRVEEVLQSADLYDWDLQDEPKLGKGKPLTP